jgi:hypothetical protein
VFVTVRPRRGGVCVEPFLSFGRPFVPPLSGWFRVDVDGATDTRKVGTVGGSARAGPTVDTDSGAAVRAGDTADAGAIPSVLAVVEAAW